MNELKDRIHRLKKEKDAVVLAHYYVNDEVQEVADYIGDSFYLSQVATEVEAKTIVFCGVSFMGESAKILNPGKNVRMPDLTADCPMAHMVVRETIEKSRAQYEDLAVVCYINSTAKIKSWSDVSVTSANAVQIVRNLPNQHILFIPDRNLAHFVAEQVPEKQFVFNEGYCPIHENMRAAELEELKIQHPSARVLVHPECSKEVLSLADYIGSTSGIIQFAKESAAKEFIIGTESGVQYALQQARRDAVFYFPKTEPVCTDMKRITLEKIINVLKYGTNEVHMENGQADEAAKQTLTRMLALA